MHIPGENRSGQHFLSSRSFVLKEKNQTYTVFFRRLQCLSTPHVTIESKIGWEYSKCIVFFSTLQATFLLFQRWLSFYGIATYGDVFLLQRLLIPHQACCAPVQQLYVCQAAEACRSNQSPHFLSRIESFHESFCSRPFS